MQTVRSSAFTPPSSEKPTFVSAFWPLPRQGSTCHEINHCLGDVGRVIANSLSMFFETNSRCVQNEMLRGSSVVLKVRRSRKAQEDTFRASRSASCIQTSRARQHHAARKHGSMPRKERPPIHCIDRSPMMQRGMCISPASLIARLAIFLARSPMRSRLPEIRIVAIISRRSIAIGWRRSIVRIAASWISRSNISRRRSLLTVAPERSVSKLNENSRRRIAFFQQCRPFPQSCGRGFRVPYHKL